MSKGKVFTAQEVQAIISGNKKMFREVIKVQPTNARQQILTNVSSTNKGDKGKSRWAELDNRKLNILNKTDYFKCPYQIGQKIFVKESFGEDWFNNICYKATDQAKYAVSSWKPATHMKQEHSRLTLLIKEIRAEKLQHISQEDCEKEGIGYTGGWNGENYDDGEFFFGKLIETEDGMNWKNEMFEYPDLAFEKYWDSTHKKPEEKFEANPWVWSIQFEVINE